MTYAHIFSGHLILIKGTYNLKTVILGWIKLYSVNFGKEKFHSTPATRLAISIEKNNSNDVNISMSTWQDAVLFWQQHIHRRIWYMTKQELAFHSACQRDESRNSYKSRVDVTTWTLLCELVIATRLSAKLGCRGWRKQRISKVIGHRPIKSAGNKWPAPILANTCSNGSSSSENNSCCNNNSNSNSKISSSNDSSSRNNTNCDYKKQHRQQQ